MVAFTEEILNGKLDLCSAGCELNVHKTFRRCVRRILNALCMFNYVLPPWMKFHAFHVILHRVKIVRFRSFSGPYFPAFGLNTVSVSCSNLGKYGPEKLRIQTPFTQFYLVTFFLQTPILICIMMKS